MLTMKIVASALLLGAPARAARRPDLRWSESQLHRLKLLKKQSIPKLKTRLRDVQGNPGDDYDLVLAALEYKCRNHPANDGLPLFLKEMNCDFHMEVKQEPEKFFFCATGVYQDTQDLRSREAMYFYVDTSRKCPLRLMKSEIYDWDARSSAEKLGWKRCFSLSGEELTRGLERCSTKFRFPPERIVRNQNDCVLKFDDWNRVQVSHAVMCRLLKSGISSKLNSCFPKADVAFFDNFDQMWNAAGTIVTSPSRKPALSTCLPPIVSLSTEKSQTSSESSTPRSRTVSPARSSDRSFKGEEKSKEKALPSHRVDGSMTRSCFSTDACTQYKAKVRKQTRSSRRPRRGSAKSSAPLRARKLATARKDTSNVTKPGRRISSTSRPKKRPGRNLSSSRTIPKARHVRKAKRLRKTKEAPPLSPKTSRPKRGRRLSAPPRGIERLSALEAKWKREDATLPKGIRDKLHPSN